MTRTMWKELKELIKARVGDGSRPRRTGLPRFRGQFEQLETRAVLSATIGVMAVDFEAGTITFAVWEARPQLPEPPRFAAFHPESQFDGTRFEGEMIDQAPWESNYGGQNNYVTGFNGGPGPFGFFDRHPSAHPLLAMSNGGVQNDGRVFNSNPSDIESPLSNNGKGDSGPLNATSPESDNAGAEDLGQGGLNLNNLVAQNQNRREPPPPPLKFTVSFPSFSAVSEAVENNTLSSSTSLDAHDAAFDEYSPQSLLLAANVDDDADDDDPLGLGDDERDTDKEQEESADETAVAIAGDAAESLDALEREEAAIDAVLAELHNLNLHQDEQATDVVSARDQSKSDRPHESSEHDPSTDDRGFDSSTFSQADGGMVLLEPTGDANSSAYDLTAVFTGKFARPHDVALGLEATVGLQQAFDVGSNERLDTAGARTPVAQPAAATAQPSVSAENAPAKKSEQPS